MLIIIFSSFSSTCTHHTFSLPCTLEFWVHYPDTNRQTYHIVKIIKTPFHSTINLNRLLFENICTNDISFLLVLWNYTFLCNTDWPYTHPILYAPFLRLLCCAAIITLTLASLLKIVNSLKIH